MSDWASYRVADFIPFTAEAYFRLLERMGETYWPLHLITLALGFAAVILALNHRTRHACMLIVPAWVFVGFVFFIQHYAELNWAGKYFGWAFFIQAIILSIIAITGRGLGKSPHHRSLPVLIGTLITAFGFLGYPLITLIVGQSWYQAETFAIHPDPTMIVTLGLTLISLRGTTAWVAAFIPILWGTYSALTLLALGAPTAIVLFTALGLAVLMLAWEYMPR